MKNREQKKSNNMRKNSFMLVSFSTQNGCESEKFRNVINFLDNVQKVNIEREKNKLQNVTVEPCRQRLSKLSIHIRVYVRKIINVT